MALQDGPLTGAPLGFPNLPATIGNITQYGMTTQQTEVAASGSYLVPIFESPQAVSGDFEATLDTLTCLKAGQYQVSANLSITNANVITAVNKLMNLECAVNGGPGSAAVQRLAESAMYDGQVPIRRTLALPQSVITLAVGDTVQFYIIYDTPGTPQSYNIEVYSNNPGALTWAKLERVGD